MIGNFYHLNSPNDVLIITMLNNKQTAKMRTHNPKFFPETNKLLVIKLLEAKEQNYMECCNMPEPRRRRRRHINSTLNNTRARN